LNNIFKAPLTRESGVYKVPLQILTVEEFEGSNGGNGSAGCDHDDPLAAEKWEAEEIIRRAEKEAEDLRNAAYIHALNQGKEEGQKIARQESEKLLEQAHEALTGALKLRETIIKSAEIQVLELAFQVAETLLYAKLEADRNVILNIVSQAISLTVGEENIAVKVNPADFPVCRQNKDFFLEFLTEEARMKFSPDEEIPRGSCRVQAQHSLVESFLQERLETMKRALLKGVDYGG
jgi:flagellar biosynthesis/type III secretory pathway protein FliH